jgi:alkanesulfonate monooxygenase
MQSRRSEIGDEHPCAHRLRYDAAVHVIGGAVDTRRLRDFARAHEDAGFDRVLVGYTSTSAEGFAVAAYAAAHTERLA